MMNRGCLLPKSVGRQLAGTVREQLAHLACDVSRLTAAAALSGDGLQGFDRQVLADKVYGGFATPGSTVIPPLYRDLLAGVAGAEGQRSRRPLCGARRRGRALRRHRVH